MSEISRCSLNPQPPADSELIIVPFFCSDPSRLPAFCPEPVLSLVKDGQAPSRYRSCTATYEQQQQWVLVGGGEQAACSVEKLRCLAAQVIDFVSGQQVQKLAWCLPHIQDLSADQVLCGFMQGALLRAFSYETYKTQQSDVRKLKEIVFVPESAEVELRETLDRTWDICCAANHARELQHGPPNEVNPDYLVTYAQQLAESQPNLTTTVLRRDDLAKRQMGCFLAVAAGAKTEPALIEIAYEHPQVVGSKVPHIALVGKGVTFDTGGISLKPPADMKKMRSDMSGGAAVFAVMEALAKLQLPLKVTGIVGAVENLPGPEAMLPGDIVRAANGLTVQIVNTDAEGRLVLADCLHYACSQGAKKIINIATLTGAVRLALGAHRCGLMSNNDELAKELDGAGQRSGELTWRLPLDDAYFEYLKSDDADCMNAVENRMAGTVTAGKFLEQFVDGRPWAHLDIAAVAWDRGVPYAEKGGSGFGVRLLVEFLSQDVGHL